MLFLFSNLKKKFFKKKIQTYKSNTYEICIWIYFFGRMFYRYIQNEQGEIYCPQTQKVSHVENTNKQAFFTHKKFQ